MSSSKSLRRRLSYKIGAIAFKVAKRIVARRDPLKAERVGMWLGRFAYLITRKHRRRAWSNLKLCFPEMLDGERKALVIKCFEHFGQVTTDLMSSDLRAPGEIASAIECIEGKEYLDQVLSSGQGAVMITGHFGNWERLGTYAAAVGRDLYVVQRDANDKGLNETIKRLRESAGMKVLSRGNAIRAMLEVLRKNQFVGMLTDQNSDEIYVKFFGYPCGTVLGPAVLHLRTGVPLIPTYLVRIGPNRYKLIFHPPLAAPADAEDAKAAITQAMNDSLETVIRLYPDQWLWLHDRWKNARRKGLVPGP